LFAFPSKYIVIKTMLAKVGGNPTFSAGMPFHFLVEFDASETNAKIQK